MIKNYIIGIVSVLAAFMVLGLLEGTITGNFVNDKEDEKVIINFPKSADFLGTEQGTVVFEFRFPDASFKVGNKTADILMFLDSEVIPGLKIGYDTEEKKIRGGLPTLSSNDIGLIDGNYHKLVYMFHKGEKKQSLILDDQILAEGEFTGEKSGEIISGFSIYQKWTIIESPIGIDVSFE